MGDQKQLEECIRYFRQRKIYDKLFAKAADKYRSLGYFGGSVRLSGLSTEDCRQLEGFFQKDYEGQKTVTILAAAMEKALADSRFAALSWEEILQGYFGRELVGRKAQNQKEKVDLFDRDAELAKESRLSGGDDGRISWGQVAFRPLAPRHQDRS